MNQQELYDKKIKDLEREILNLKTGYFKTATTISTTTKNTTLNFSLALDSLSGTISSSQRAIITLTTNNNTNMINACYLVGATPTNLDSRTVQIQRLRPINGTIRFGIAVFSQNQNDFNTLMGGGSVNLSYTIQAVGSSDFSLSISYKPITGGTL